MNPNQGKKILQKTAELLGDDDKIYEMIRQWLENLLIEEDPLKTGRVS